MFTGVMPWDEESLVRLKGCGDKTFMLTIVSRVYGDMGLMVREGEVSRNDLEEDGVSDVVEDIFTDEEPRKGRVLDFFSDDLNNLLADIFETS